MSALRQATENGAIKSALAEFESIRVLETIAPFITSQILARAEKALLEAMASETLENARRQFAHFPQIPAHTMKNSDTLCAIAHIANLSVQSTIKALCVIALRHDMKGFRKAGASTSLYQYALDNAVNLSALAKLPTKNSDCVAACRYVEFLGGIKKPESALRIRADMVKRVFDMPHNFE